MSLPVRPAIAVRDLVKRYGGRAVVDGVSFEVSPGETLAILGPNGAGKTTTVELLEGYRSPDGGEARVLGLDPIRDGATLKPRLGVMLQGGGVYPQARPLEALRHFAAFYADPIAPEEVLRAVGLERAARTPFRRLSGGEKQRLSLGLAIIGRPEVLFLDEPTAAMDPEARRATWALIRRLQQEGATVVLTTHFMEEAEQLADRMAIIAAGRLVALGTPDALRAGGAARINLRTAAAFDTGALAAHLGCEVRAEDGGGRYVLHVEPSPVLLASLTAWLAECDVLLLELHAGGGSFEDVYLQLVGSEARS